MHNIPEVATILPAELLPSLSKSSFLVFSKDSFEREALPALGETRGSDASCWRVLWPDPPKSERDLEILCLATLGEAKAASDSERGEYIAARGGE